MRIASIILKRFRKFKFSVIHFNGNSLVIGANDVGKTNLFYAIRLLFGRSIPEIEMESQDSDFNSIGMCPFFDQAGIERPPFSLGNLDFFIM